MDRNGTNGRKHTQTVRRRRGKCEPRLVSVLFRDKTAENLFFVVFKISYVMEAVLSINLFFTCSYFKYRGIGISSFLSASLNKYSQPAFCCGPNRTLDFSAWPGSSTPLVAPLWKRLHLREVSQQQMVWLYTNHLLHFCIQESAKKLNREVCQVSPGIAFV